MHQELPNGYVLVRFFSSVELRRRTDEDVRYGRTYPSISIKVWPLPTPEQIPELLAECNAIAAAKMGREEAEKFICKKG